jgi:predicted amidohydrolase
MNSSADIEANLKSVADLAERASKRQAKMLFLPECFAFLGSVKERKIGRGSRRSNGEGVVVVVVV